MHKIVFLFLWILFSFIFARFLEQFIIKEPFTSSTSFMLSSDLNSTVADFNPDPGTRILNKNSDSILFPSSKNNGISNNSAFDIWWHYPVFKVGSFAQITNNLKYPNNPDEGTCMPASMCGTLYLDKVTPLPSNNICPLPPVEEEQLKRRVNYYYFGKI